VRDQSKEITMSSTPTPPVVPVPGDDGDDEERVGQEGLLNPIGDDDQPLDPDLNDDMVNSADADERAATEGELDGSGEQ
jgi:hypothetical protein